MEVPVQPVLEPTTKQQKQQKQEKKMKKAKKAVSEQSVPSGQEEEGDEEAFDPSSIVHESLLPGAMSIEETIRHRRRRQRGEAADGEDEEMEAEDALVEAKGRKALSKKPKAGKPAREPEDPTKGARTLFVGNVSVLCLEKVSFTRRWGKERSWILMNYENGVRNRLNSRN